MRGQHREQLRSLLGTRVHNSRELTQLLNISQPTLSRLINDMGQELVTMGKGRATCYGLPRKIHDQDSRFPVYRIDPRGDAHHFGTLLALQGGQYWWEDANEAGELFPHLPWFILDLQMSGFGARIFAYRHSDSLNLPRKISDWNSSDRLFAISRCGEDRSGNLIIGEQSLARYFEQARQEPQLIDIGTKSWIYPQLAQQALSGELNAAQVGGEQPKFTICINDQGAPCQTLVKFSPAVDSNEARRYADLLVCEHLALETIRLAGRSAARSRLITAGHQVFLCLKRFDRRGAIGRLPLVSLRALHEKLQTPCDTWVDAATRLHHHKLISADDAEKILWLALFSDLIGNSNQHFANISLIPHQQDSFLLAPAYGIRPTLYEPVAGELPACLFTPPAVRNEASAQLSSALDAAILFWKSAAVDERISADFRQICYENCELLKLQKRGPQLIIPNQKS